MERRDLLTTIVADSSGILGTHQGNLYQYSDASGYTPLGIGQVAQVVDSHNPAGQEEIFALKTTGAVFSYSLTTKTWTFTGGYLQSMVADVDGIAGLDASGNLYLYRDGGWNLTDGRNVVSVVNSVSGTNQDELFAENASGNIYEYVPALSRTHYARFTAQPAGKITGLVPFRNGVAGINGGLVDAYSDGSGWTQLPFSAVVSLEGSLTLQGVSELFALNSGSEVYSYNGTTGKVAQVSGGVFATGIAADGAEIGVNLLTAGGGAFHYADNTGLLDLHAIGATDLIGSTSSTGTDKLYAQVASGLVYEYDFDANAWSSTGGILDASHAVAPTVPVVAPGLSRSLSGTFSDYYTTPPNSPSPAQHGYTTGQVAITISSVVPSGTAGVDNVSGTLTITDGNGYFTQSHDFTGTYNTLGVPPTLTIQSSPSSSAGSFAFTFQLTPTGGLYEDPTTAEPNFSISRLNSGGTVGYTDAGDPIANDPKRKVSLTPQ
jgi:hypothetical protein